MTRSIYLLKDTEKIGLYVQLLQEALDAFVFIYRVEGNDEFSEIIHLCLFAFDSVSNHALTHLHMYRCLTSTMTWYLMIFLYSLLSLIHI